MPKSQPRRGFAQQKEAGQRNRPAVGRSLQILEAMAALDGPASLADLTRALDLPQATTFRLCQRLEEDGYIVRDGGTRKFTIGARLMRLGLDIIRNSGPLSIRRKILSDLVETVGETCNLTTLAGTEVLYLDRVETRWPLRLSLEPGSRVPLHCTSSGKLLLASLPKPRQQQFLKALTLTANTPSTITDATELNRELQRIARRGFSTDNEEFLVGLVAVAVPVKDSGGKTCAAIACHAPVSRLSMKDAIALAPVLKAAAAKLGQTFDG